MPNSEMGLMALMLDKQLSMVSHTKEDREKSLLDLRKYLPCNSKYKCKRIADEIILSKELRHNLQF